MKILYFIIGLCVLLLCGCNQTNANAPTTISAPIQFAVTQAPLNLDPRYASDAASERVNRLIYQPLVDFDAQSKPAPRLASWVEVNSHQYRFTLNKVRAPFHHGKLLTALDVKATYDSLAQLKNSPHTAEFSNIKSIEVENENTVLFHLKQPDNHLPAKLIIGILPQDLIKKNYDFSHHPIGSGVLQFVSWQNKLVLKRMTDGQMITLIEVKDPTVRVLKLLRDEVDLLQGDLPPELIKHLQTKPEITVNTSQGANFSYLGLNMQDSFLINLKVRQAIAHAIDRQAIIEQVMVENTRFAGAILPPEHYAGNANLKPYEYNPAKARQLLIEAGVKLPLKLVYKTSTDAQRVRFATILQAQMLPAGIDLEIHSLDWGTFFEDVKQGQFQLFGLTWVGIKTPEIYAKAFGSQNFAPNGFNRGRFADAALDALLAKEDWVAATKHIHEQLPYIPLWYEGQFAAFNKNIKNYVPKPDGNWDDLATISKYAH
ncbi:MAG: ABC transporter substrate-binding protein [Methylotenera sp.]|nr:ABC transporter substrate-binding protein [Methylotenera sp.]